MYLTVHFADLMVPSWGWGVSQGPPPVISRFERMRWGGPLEVGSHVFLKTHPIRSIFL